MSEEVDLDAVKDELTTAAHNSISRILQYLATHYSGHFPDEVELNKVFLEMATHLVGEMLAHFPEDVRDDITDIAYEHIAYIKDMTEVELAMDKNIAEVEEEIQPIITGYDLKAMKPVGNC